jgi:transposase
VGCDKSWESLESKNQKQGEGRHILLGGHNGVPFTHNEGKPRQYVAIRVDITERKLTEMASTRLAAIVDSQSVKPAPHGGKVGYDAAKRIKGRKRHLLVDTLGLVLGILVNPAEVPERAGAQELLDYTLTWFTWLRMLWLDSGYSGPDFAQWVKRIRPQLEVQVVERTDDLKGFKVLPHRWLVERTFGVYRNDTNSNPPPRLIPCLN